jgi:site-specific recombinase XerD
MTQKHGLAQSTIQMKPSLPNSFIHDIVGSMAQFMLQHGMAQFMLQHGMAQFMLQHGMAQFMLQHGMAQFML